MYGWVAGQQWVGDEGELGPANERLDLLQAALLVEVLHHLLVLPHSPPNPPNYSQRVEPGVREVW